MNYLNIEFPDTMSLSHLKIGDLVNVLCGRYHSQGRVIKIEQLPGESQSLTSCSEENPCCDRRGEYNGFGSGSLKFVCPKHCPCHD